MQLNIFGIIWGLLLVWSFAKPINIIGKLYLWSFVFQASCILTIGTQTINVSVVTGLVLIIRCLIQFAGKIEVNKVTKSWMMFFCIAVIVSLIASKAFVGIEIFSGYEANGRNILTLTPYDGTTGLYRFIILLVYILASTLLPEVLKRLSCEDVIRQFSQIIAFVLCIGVLQYSITLIKNESLGQIYNLLLYTDTTTFNGVLSYFRRPRLFATFIEPSYCAIFLTAAFWACLLIDDKYRMKKYCPIILIEIFLTFSSTAYATLILGAVIYLAVEKKYKALRNIFLGSIVFAIVIVATGAYNTIYETIFEKLSTNSGMTRSAWDQVAWNNFVETKGIGMGYRTIRANSMLINILGQIGVIGLLSFSYAIWATLRDSIKYLKSNEIGGVCRFSSSFLLVSLIAQIIACPDLDNSVLWLAISITVIISDYARHYYAITKNIM